MIPKIYYRDNIHGISYSKFRKHVVEHINDNEIFEFCNHLKTKLDKKVNIIIDAVQTKDPTLLDPPFDVSDHPDYYSKKCLRLLVLELIQHHIDTTNLRIGKNILFNFNNFVKYIIFKNAQKYFNIH